jgi:hypothetical protein
VSESSKAPRRLLRLDVPIDDDAGRQALRSALLAARASELSEIQRRAARHTFGYGSDTARDTMADEVADRRRRWEMLDRLLSALDAAPDPGSEVTGR